MPSNMAIHPLTPTQSIFSSKSKKKQASMKTAASYLAAVSDAHGLPRSRSTTPTSTPALSMSSSTTAYSRSLSEVGDGEDAGLVEAEYDGPLSRPSNPPTSEQVFHTVHTEFGHCSNPEYRYEARYRPGAKTHNDMFEEPPYYVLIATYISYLILICFGHLRDFFGKRLKANAYKHLAMQNGYAPLNSDFDSFYTRRLKMRLDEAFARPVTGVPGRTIALLDREANATNSKYIFTGSRTRTLNIASYNYLGFAQGHGGCAEAARESIQRYGLSACGPRREVGTTDLHIQAESLVARFVGQEDATIVSMGFATNSTIIPALASKGCLIISDELNHASIRVGARLSGASVRMFKHNDVHDLESLLREVISQGQPRTHRSWKKILVIVEGLFSMEGDMCNLPAIIELRRKYKFHLFVDEAHSIGALGPNGRGVVDYFGANPREVDILMGTFTKSFGAAGGYIAGNKSVVDALRLRSHSHTYGESISPPVLAQIVSSMATIMGVSPPLPPTSHSNDSINPASSTDTITPVDYAYPGPVPAAALPPWLNLPPHMRDGSEGKERLRRIAFNARYLARGLKKLGLITYGDPDSPVIPLLLYTPAKMSSFSKLILDAWADKPPISVVVVAYPATPLTTARVRFCVSASHTKEDMDTVLLACDRIGDLLDLKHGHGERWSLEEISNRAVELVNEL